MFKKYSSIDNHYSSKYIMNSISQHPELETEIFSLREKIDGANIQLFFKKGETVKAGKRSSFLEEGDSFFDIWTVLNRNHNTIKQFEDYVEYTGNELRVYGELYGPGINNRVNYGDTQDILFFDAEINGNLISQYHFEVLMRELDLTHKLVPLVGYADSLIEALEFSCDFNSKVTNIENNPAEGFVIKPYSHNFYMGNGTRFIVKKKSEAFKESESVPHKGPEINLSTDEVQLMLAFRGYINNNRVLSIFSKYGPIQEVRQTGEYIKLILEDAKKDFLTDYTLPATIDKKIEKKIFNVGGHIVNLLKEHL